MADYIDNELQPLVRKLRARYPGVRIVEASSGTTLDGAPSQNIRFQAPIGTLKRCGLVTDEMLRKDKHGRYVGWRVLGDHVNIYESLDAESRPGCVDVSAHTLEWFKERHFSVKMAQRMLKQIAKASKAPSG